MSGGGRSTWPVPGDAAGTTAGKEQRPPETGLCSSRVPRSRAGGPRAPSRQGSGGGDASSFPGPARMGGHDILGVPSRFPSATGGHPPPALPLGKEEISRSGSSGSDEGV